MSKLSKTKTRFQFYTKLDLEELTGLKASSIKDLVHHLKSVPDSVIYFHTHRFLQQHQFLRPGAPNDFAYWVSEVLGHKNLGEKLASVNIHEYTTIDELRHKLMNILDEFQKKKEKLRYASKGQEFHFIKSVSFVFPTPYYAHDLKNFVKALRHVTVHSIYFHMFEAKLRLKKGSNDFSFWMESSLLEGELAKRIARLDPYTHTMVSLRNTIITLVNQRIKRRL